MTTEPSKVKPAFDQGVIDFPAADFVTVMTSADGKVLTKRHTPAGMIDFDGGKWFTSREVPIGSLADLAAALECPSDSCVILGRIKPGVDPSQRHRRLLHPAKDDGTPPSYDPAAHDYVLLDVDEKPPRGADGKPDPEYALTPAAWVHDIPGTMRRVLRDWLPPELSGVAFKWWLTSSAGLKPGIHVRLAFMLDRAVSSHELDMWFADYPHVDKAAFRPVQPIYGAAPIFDGVADPVKQRSGGFRGEREHVAVPADLAARVKQRKEREIETGWQQGSPIDLAEIEKMIEVIPPPEDYETIKRVAAALGDANVPDDPDLSERLELFTDWNSRGSVRDHDGEDRHFERLFRDMARPAPVGTEPTRVGTLIKIAQLNGYELPPPNPAEQFGTADTFDQYLPSEILPGSIRCDTDEEGCWRLEIENSPEVERQLKVDRAAFEKTGWQMIIDLMAEVEKAGRKALSRFGFGGRRPSEGKNLPELEYFDQHKSLPKVPDKGCVGLAIGQWHSHKTGTLIKYGLDACDAGYRVLFVAAEDNHGIEKLRVPAAIEARGHAPDHYDDLWCTEPATLLLRNKAIRDDLIRTYRAQGFIPDLVFIDVLAKTIPGADANSGKDAGEVVMALEEIAKGFGGATVIATRHPPLSTDNRGTGTNEFPALVYFQWLIKAEGSIVTLHVDKMKNGESDFDVRYKVGAGIPVLSDMSAEDEAEVARRTVKTTGPDPIIADTIAVLMPGAAPISMGALTRRLRDLSHGQYSVLVESDLTTRIKLAVWGRTKKHGWSGVPAGALAISCQVTGEGAQTKYAFRVAP